MMIVIRRILLYLSLCLAVGSLIYLLGMLKWAYSLDDDFSARYACCTQEANTAFHMRFWWRFFIAVKLGLAGCLGLAATLASRTVLKLGLMTLATTVALLVVNFATMNLHGWSGATGFTITLAVFWAGLSFVIVGAARIGWLKFRATAA